MTGRPSFSAGLKCHDLTALRLIIRAAVSARFSGKYFALTDWTAPRSSTTISIVTRSDRRVVAGIRQSCCEESGTGGTTSVSLSLKVVAAMPRRSDGASGAGARGVGTGGGARAACLESNAIAGAGAGDSVSVGGFGVACADCGGWADRPGAVGLTGAIVGTVGVASTREAAGATREAAGATRAAAGATGDAAGAGARVGRLDWTGNSSALPAVARGASASCVSGVESASRAMEPVTTAARRLDGSAQMPMPIIATTTAARADARSSDTDRPCQSDGHASDLTTAAAAFGMAAVTIVLALAASEMKTPSASDSGSVSAAIARHRSYTA